MAAKRWNILADRFAVLIRRTRGAFRQSRVYNRPFSDTAARKVLLLSIDERIPQSQIHPFHVYADQILDQHGAEIRETTVEQYLKGAQPGLDGATTVCFQTNFDVSDEDLDRLMRKIRRRNPKARLVYLDWFAPTDLRLAQRMHPYVDIYVKKHVFSDLSRYGKPTIGDTNLTDFYARRFGIDMPQTVFAIPEGFLDKLLVGPSFVTADFMIGTFAGPAPLGGRERPIDIHARLAVNGTDWYRQMRAESHAAVTSLSGVTALTETGVGLVQYLHELRSSKLCFSPFGYGEVCWRDYEAVANGAVVLKPDMSHIRTEPNIFIAGETYAPLRWDLEDFDERVRHLLDDTDECQRLAENAFSVLHDYVSQDRFVTQMARIFD